MTPEALIARIEAAFEEGAWPGDAHLASDSYGDEPAAVARDFAGRNDWRSLDAAFLDQAPEGWSSALSFLSPEAYRYYLPAYLIADVLGRLTRVDPSFRLCAFLAPQSAGQKIAKVFGGGTMGDHARNLFDGFTMEQAAAITAYLRWKVETDPCADPEISEALRIYWSPRSQTAPRF